MLFRLVGAESAGDLARRLTVAAVKLTLSAEAVQAGLAHTVEGITTPLLREEAPVDTGALRDSLRAHVSRDSGGFTVRYESDVPYADFVEHGTGLYHVPDAHSAWDGHEGQHPNPFAERAYDRAEPAIRAALVLAGEKVLVSFAESF
jgi:HK97 gp10 family phage protein